MRRGGMLLWALTAGFAAACTGPDDPPAARESPADAVAAGPAPAEPGWTGLTEPEEVIEARRLLMIETERLMQPIDSFIVGEPADAAALRENARAIEAMLLALPHLFPPTTNRYDATVLDPPTIALPSIWQRYEAFMEQAGAGEAAVAELIAAADEDSLRAASVRLRAACDACHAAFTQPYTPPVVTEQDLEFDFESALPDE